MSADSTAVRTCARCVLDTHDDPSLTFDDAGVCSSCRRYEAMERAQVPKGDDAKKQLAAIVERVKKAGRGRPYDAVIGVSGGVDSTYLSWLAHEHGLRVLAVHFDNGWNSELAVHNIENIVRKLGFDLITYVVNWDEFRDLQLAYLKASVVDIEAITDHAIIGTVFRIAAENRTKFVLSGTNVVTEAVLPSSWIHNKYDHVNIRAIHAQYGTVPLATFPFFSFWKKKYYGDVLRIRSVSMLNYVPYVKHDVKKFITDELGWRDYGGKHYESIWTRFYQGHILPKKFGIDKRKAHLSNLICSGQITRDEALEELKKPAYDPEVEKVDKEFVLKKLGLSSTEFDELMKMPVKKHTDFATETSIYEKYPLLSAVKPMVTSLRKLTS